MSTPLLKLTKNACYIYLVSNENRMEIDGVSKSLLWRNKCEHYWFESFGSMFEWFWCVTWPQNIYQLRDEFEVCEFMIDLTFMWLIFILEIISDQTVFLFLVFFFFLLLHTLNNDYNDNNNNDNKDNNTNNNCCCCWNRSMRYGPKQFLN